MTATLVQTISGNGGGYVHSYTIATTGAVVAGNTLTLTLGCGDGDTFTITDDKSNSWVSDVMINLSTQRETTVLHANNCAAGVTTITIQFGSGQFNDSAVIVDEWSGMPTTNNFDKSATSTTNGTGTTYASGNTPSTTQAAEVLIGAITVDNNSPGFTGDAAFTGLLTQAGFDLYTSIARQYKIVSSTGAYGWTVTNGSAYHAAQVLATYKQTVVITGNSNFFAFFK